MKELYIKMNYKVIKSNNPEARNENKVKKR